MSRTDTPSDPTRSLTRVSRQFPVATAYPGRAGWSGCLRFRLVAIPVTGHPMLRPPERVDFHLIHRGCGQRIRLAKHCPSHGPVATEEIAKGYQHAPGQWVTIDPSDLRRALPDADKTVSLDKVLDPNKVDPALYSGRSLFLLPDGPTARRPYAVMGQALRQARKWALGRAQVSGAKCAVLVRPLGTGLALDLLRDPSLLSNPPGENAAPVIAVSNEELALAGRLLDALNQPFRWADYREDTPDRLSAVIEAKVQGRELPPPAPEAAPDEIISLEAALRQSLGMSRTQRKPASSRPSGSKPRRRTT